MLDYLLILTTIVVLAALFGSMMFFAFVAAPAVHRHLPSETAGEFLRQLFPNYYMAATGACFVGAALAAAPNWIVAVLLAVLGLSFVYAWIFLLPRVNRARDQMVEGRVAFVRLHKQSMWLNIGQLIGALGLMLFLIITGPLAALLSH